MALQGHVKYEGCQRCRQNPLFCGRLCDGELQWVWHHAKLPPPLCHAAPITPQTTAGGGLTRAADAIAVRANNIFPSHIFTLARRLLLLWDPVEPWSVGGHGFCFSREGRLIGQSIYDFIAPEGYRGLCCRACCCCCPAPPESCCSILGNFLWFSRHIVYPDSPASSISFL